MDGSLIRKLIAFALFAPALARADAVNNEWLSTTRNLSMGNVGIASSEDPASAMFYNPAALARAKHASFDILDPQIDVGQSVFGLGKAKGLGDNLSLAKVQPSLLENPGKASSLGASLYPNLYLKNFDFGILMSAQGSSYSDGTKTYYQSQYLVMPTIAYSAAFLENRFRLGVAARGISLTSNDQSTTATSDIGYRTNAGQGFGLGVDAGALLALPTEGLPTLGVVARNIGDTKFTTNAPIGFGTGTVYRLPPLVHTYDAGFSIFPKLGQHTVLTLAADYRDILDNTHTSLGRHINVGTELGVSHQFYLRAGVSRGYITGGVGLATRYGSLDIGTYSEELNDTNFRSQEDRRFSFRYGSRF